MRRLLPLLAPLLLSACSDRLAASAALASPASSAPPAPPAATVELGAYEAWPMIFAGRACGERVRLSGRGEPGTTRVLALQGARHEFMPAPSFVATLGEAPVGADGRYEMDLTIAPTLALDGGKGTLRLESGRTYGIFERTRRADGSDDGGAGYSSYTAFPMPAGPCAASVAQPSVRISPEAPCPGQGLVITGTGFQGPRARLALWATHQVPAGGLDTGKEPPRIIDLGPAPVDASGALRLEVPGASSPIEAGMRYSLVAYDQDETRETRLVLAPCAAP